MNSFYLQELLEIKNGRDHKHLSDGNIPIYGSGGLMRFGNQFIYDKESILLPRKGTLSNIQFVNKPFWTVDTLYYTVINKEKAHPYFLYHYLKRLDLSNLNSGTGVPSMIFGAYYGVKLQIPDLQIQSKIAAALSALDDKIELNNQINTELEQMAKALYDYWFVQFDFPFDFAQGKPSEEGKPYKSSGGEMVYNAVLKREIPKGWEVKRLSQIANITMGQSPSGTSYNQDEQGMMFFQGSTDFEWRFPTVRMYTTAPTRFALEGDMLLSVRAPIGTMNVAATTCCIGRGLAALNSKDGYNSYLIYQMNYFKKKFDYLNSVGTTFGSLTKDDLYNLELVYPSKEILINFEKIVSTFDKKIKINSLQNQELASLRDWLLPMLMNGQVRVGEN
ncbi:restriction endonuclease subunit S [Kaistella carnis]|uniref:restriction endonuclease subunit S n=1 Tax=Kaistella carnis TaxID=1241979 RepID=UPI0028A87202|nr:restriction endonuclease subunit S [Kaistella carnis]